MVKSKRKCTYWPGKKFVFQREKGVSSLEEKNLALLGKWFHKWYKEKDKSWNVQIRDKYEVNKISGLEELTVSKKASGMMKDVIGIEKMGGSSSQLSKSNFRWKMNNGALTLFWEDILEGKRALKDNFSRLYSISKWKEIEVSYFKDLWEV